MQKMSDIMTSLRNSHPTEIAGFKVTDVADYLNSYTKSLETGKTQTINLPKSNVLSYSLEGGGAAIVRPSGTEPKIKVYITSVGKNDSDAESLANKMVNAMTSIMGI